jgi:hypothetical protein
MPWLQLPEQQFAWVVHSSPVALQEAHRPWLHTPLQH